jgi:RsiW-degrading membrane proteinase PrsW (M82 family)
VDGQEPWGGPGEDYRLRRIARREGAAEDASASGAAPAAGPPRPDSVAPVWQPPARRRSVPWFEVVLITAGVLGVAVLLAQYVLTGGVATTAQMTTVALVPLALVLAVLGHIDRWEPEPLWPRLVALAWGAGVAALAASIVNTAMLMNVAQVTGDYQGAMASVSVLVAPVVEETLKGAGVLALVLWRRSSVNSVLDGVIYAGYVGAGFAFVENIGYFLQASGSGSGVLGATVFLRGVLSPFVHPMATSFTGMALAWAVVGTRSRWSWTWIGPLGWAAAMGVHGLWNFLGTQAGLSWFGWYLVVEVPLFAVWVTALLVASRREARRIARGLAPYVRTGWMLPAEVPMVVDRGGRRAARRWASTGGRDSARAMRTFQRDAACLGLDQMIMTAAGPQADRIDHDRTLLAELGEARGAFLRDTRLAAAQAGMGRP